MSDPGFRLYGRRGSGSMAVQVALEEIGVPYEIVWIERTPEAMEALRRVNPAGRIPALQLPGGAVMAESAAMLIHLAGAYPGSQLAPPAGTAAHARFLQWMVYLSANLYETALRYFYSERYSADPAAATGVKARAAEDYLRQLKFAEAALDPYLGGATFSAADPYLYMIAGWYPDGLGALPKLVQHAQLLRRRPSIVKADQDHAET